MVVAAVGLCIALGAWWVLGRGRAATHALTGDGSHGRASARFARGATDPATGAPHWLGQGAARRIAGIVVDERGQPVRGATVRAVSQYTNAGLVKTAPRTTDDAGRFDFGAQPATTYVVSAEQKGTAPALRIVELRDPAQMPAPDQLTLVLHPCLASIHGTVHDAAGGEIAGAALHRVEYSIITEVGVVADEHGAYELCVEPGRSEVSVSADGYAGIAEDVNVFGRTRRDFQLVPGTAVSGRVVHASDGSPVAGALVHLRASEAAQRTSSDANGAFTFEAVQPGMHEVYAFGERLASADVVEVGVEVGSPVTGIVIKVSDAFSIAGSVVERGTRRGVSGRLVHLTPVKTVVDSEQLEIVSGADGTFIIEHVLPGEYMPRVVDADEQDANKVTVASSDVSGVTLEVAPTGSIAGRVLLGGKPVDGAIVTATRTDDDTYAAVADAQGRFVVRGLLAGSYRVSAESARAGAFASGLTVVIQEREARTGVDLELDLAGSITGVVVDQNNAPVPGVFLSFSLLRRTDYGWATTADDGTFTARSLSGGGEYVLEVRPRDGSPIAFPPLGRKRHPSIVVKDGATHVTGVRVQIKYERLALGGRIVDHRGKPIPDARIVATTPEADMTQPPSAMSDENGRFSIRELTTGQYSLYATSVRGDVRLDDVAAGRTDVVLRILERGGIDGTVSGPCDALNIVAYPQEADVFRGYRAVIAGATFQLRNLPPGMYALRVTCAGVTASSHVSVITGQITTHAIKLGEVGAIAGRVVDAKTHAPLAGLTCDVSPHTPIDSDVLNVGAEDVTTDAQGRFTFARTVAAPTRIMCWSERAIASKEIEVVAGQTVQVQLEAETHAPITDEVDEVERRTGASGMTLEDQLDDVLVASVVANSPAARAGVQVGDVVISVNGRAMKRYFSELAMDMIESGDPEATLVLERNDKQLTVTLKFDPK
jgi:hypothetical protein